MFITKDYETLNLSLEGNIGVVCINRESKLNALNTQVLSELKDLLEHIINEDKKFTLKGMILTGSGSKSFIAGADISEMIDMNVDEARKFGELGQQVTKLFESLPIPIIACVNGFALGAGCEMAMSCDFIYATRNALFGQPEVNLGLIAGFGGTQRLARIVGRNRAKEILYTGRMIKSDEALEIGLAIKLFDNRDELINSAMKTLTLIQEKSPLAVSLTKKVINEGVDLTIPEGLDCELNQFSAIFGSEDKKEGTSAFLEKRAPKFTGK